MTEETVKISDAELELQLPRPVGYRILVALPQPEETVAGTSILKTETAKTQDHIMSIIGLVVDMGVGRMRTKTASPMELGAKRVTS